MTATVMRKMTSSATPGMAEPPACGNHDCELAYWISDSMIPRPIPAAQARPNEVKRAISAAVSAGTIWSGSVSESSSVIAAARMPTAPAMNEATSVLPSESSRGESPASIAATSFSDAARVARPNRDHR